MAIDEQEQAAAVAAPTSGSVPAEAPSVGNLPGQLKLMWELMIFLIAVLFLGFLGLVFSLGGMWNDYLAQKTASYEDLKDQVLSQNAKIDALTEQVKREKDTPYWAQFLISTTTSNR